MFVDKKNGLNSWSFRGTCAKAVIMADMCSKSTPTRVSFWKAALCGVCPHCSDIGACFGKHLEVSKKGAPLSLESSLKFTGYCCLCLS